MKRLVFIVLAWMALLPHLAVAADPDPEASYQALLTAAKAATGPVDWQALRYAYAERPAYDGEFDHDARDAMFRASTAHDWATVKAKATTVLDANYVDGMAHHSLAAADVALGDPEQGQKEFAMAEGIFASIRTGDGLSFDHAFTVISIAEEYDIMATMGLSLDQQSLNNHDGHMFDVMATEDEQGKKVTYYFNIDREWAAETRAMSPH